MEKPSIPQGTRDFGPLQVARRRYILDTIRRTFELFGYAPIETPTLENLSVLTGKYGDEGDQLLFKVLNSGNFLVKERRGEITPLVTPEDLDAGPKAVLPKIAEKGLRYDLTVPFARYVAMNRGTLTFPFRRYQMQPVWRADRPQRGRYREFWQCDADVVGTDSLLCEAEIVLMMSRVFEELGLVDYTIKVNHRGVLSSLLYHILDLPHGVAHSTTHEAHIGNESALFVAIDKLDKIGEIGVTTELLQKGFKSAQIAQTLKILSVTGSFIERIEQLDSQIGAIPTYENSRRNLEDVHEYLKASGFTHFDSLEFDPTLARGLSYYTGCIFEVKINNVPGMGSVSGGGRYDNLTGAFGLPGVSGVGFSFGVDRLYDCLDTLGLFPDFGETPTRVLLTHYQETSSLTLPMLAALRDARTADGSSAGIAAELYPDAGNLPKQFKYADAKNIPLVLILGPAEVAAGQAKLKMLSTRVEYLTDSLKATAVIAKIRELLP